MNLGKELILLLFITTWFHLQCLGSSRDLAKLSKDQTIGDLRVANLYADSGSRIVGAKFWHRTGAPIYLLQIETAPQVFMWVDTPTDSNRGLPHALEHLLAGKGTKGRYSSLLKEMRFSQNAAATFDDFNFYSFSSGIGLNGFFEQFHAWLDALYRPDFTDLEAEREFYHFGVSTDATTKKMTLVEKGTVYDEEQTGQGVYAYHFDLRNRLLGDINPFGFDSGGVPDEMHHVTATDIRRFYLQHYRLGPTTGFIFAVAPKEDAMAFLRRISIDLNEFSGPRRHNEIIHSTAEPKYSTRPSGNTEIKICPFPSNKETGLSEVRFAWKPSKSETQIQVKLLQLMFKALADGERSRLYSSMIDSNTRTVDSGATKIGASVWLKNSPFFPVEFIQLSGIPGNRITVSFVDQLRTHIVATLAEISQYPDNSQSLAAFNQLALAYAKAWRRSRRVWMKSAPRFGMTYATEWKEYLEYLEMDPTFVRSISEEAVWNEAETQIRSGKNIWKELVRNFGLLEVPYATASIPSPHLLQEMEKNRKDRIAERVKQLIMEFGAKDEQQALSLFAQQEANKTAEIDKIVARVPRPAFTAHPPLTKDDDIRYSQFHLGQVPVIASFFDRAPTIDVGLSFDLRRIPRKYYKYFPILPRCIDSLGLKTPAGMTSYQDLLARTETEMNDFSIQYEFNPVSHRADLTIRTSMADLAEFRAGLKLIQQMMEFNNLDPLNSNRLRDLVERRLGQEDAYSRGDGGYPYMNLGLAFQYQRDPLYVALASVVTRAHWDGRLQWLLHQPEPPEEITKLSNLTERILSSLSGRSGEDISHEIEIRRSDARGLERELLEYWGRNITAFSEAEIIPGLRRLALEIQEDLRRGPDKTIADLRELQHLVLAEDALRIDLTLDPSDLENVKAALTDFTASLPGRLPPQEQSLQVPVEGAPIMENVRNRYHLSAHDFPWFVGLPDAGSTTANMVFFADHPGYAQLDHSSLVQVLSAQLASGSGTHTLFTKTFQDGLAYSNGVFCEPSRKLIRYFAERSPDIVSLIHLVDSTSTAISELHDSSLIDYSLQRSLPVPRSMATFSERGSGLAQDIRDGNEPAVVKRFSRALLDLRKDSGLLREMRTEVLDSLGPVLIRRESENEQRSAKSLFFFVGPERLLGEAEKSLPIPKLLRLYPSDYWMDDESPSSTPYSASF